MDMTIQCTPCHLLFYKCQQLHTDIYFKFVPTVRQELYLDDISKVWCQINKKKEEEVLSGVFQS